MPWFRGCLRLERRRANVHAEAAISTVFKFDLLLAPVGRLCLDEVTTATITKVVASMRSNNYAPGTVARVVVILRFLFNLARKWKVLRGHENPAAGIPVPPDVQGNRFLDRSEIGRLVEALAKDENQVAAKAILLLLLTGARRNEVTYARWEHIDLQASTLFVPLSKSGKSRYIVLNGDAVAVLKSISRLPDNPYVFPSPVTGRPSASLYFPWHRIRTTAGLQNLRLHDLRHSFASVLVNEGTPLYTVQRLLGHANAKATQRYAHLAPETLATAAEAMGNVVGPALKRTSGPRPDARDNLPDGLWRAKRS